MSEHYFIVCEWVSEVVDIYANEADCRQENDLEVDFDIQKDDQIKKVKPEEIKKEYVDAYNFEFHGKDPEFIYWSQEARTKYLKYTMLGLEEKDL